MPKPSDKWIPWYIVAFFVVLVIVLVPFCVIAFRTYTGTVTENSYEKGLAYNRDIQASDQQKALGWQGKLSVTVATHPKEIHADFSLHDAHNNPIDNAAVKAAFIRPTQSGMDQNMKLTLQRNGQYSGELTLPADGLWDVYVSAQVDGQAYQTVKRVVIP